MQLIYFLFVLVFFSCIGQSPDNNANSTFRNVDIYLMKGIQHVKPTDVPNVTIIDSANVTLLRYQPVAGVQFTRVYRREKNQWVTDYYEQDDTVKVHVTRIVRANNIFEVGYEDNPSSRLKFVGVLEQDTFKFYFPNVNIFKDVPLDSTLLALRSTDWLVKFWYQIDNNKVKMLKQFRESPNSHPIADCYVFNELPFFWWYENQDYLPTVSCED